MDQNSRIDWIDVFKGWGIMLIVVGHLPVPFFFREWIFSFHVPLFFFISGFLYKPGKYSGSAETYLQGRYLTKAQVSPGAAQNSLRGLRPQAYLMGIPCPHTLGCTTQVV